MVNKLLKLPFLFGVGGTVYYLMEIIWRGYSHWSMFALSGVCFIIIDLLNQTWKNIRSLIFLIILCTLIITVLEFVTGLIVNLWLGLGVWDYSNMPFNLMGQICLFFSLLWLLVTCIAILVDNLLRWFCFHDVPAYAAATSYEIFSRNLELKQ